MPPGIGPAQQVFQSSLEGCCCVACISCCELEKREARFTLASWSDHRVGKIFFRHFVKAPGLVRS